MPPKPDFRKPQQTRYRDTREDQGTFRATVPGNVALSHFKDNARDYNHFYNRKTALTPIIPHFRMHFGQP